MAKKKLEATSITSPEKSIVYGLDAKGQLIVWSFETGEWVELSAKETRLSTKDKRD